MILSSTGLLQSTTKVEDFFFLVGAVDTFFPMTTILTGACAAHGAAPLVRHFVRLLLFTIPQLRLL